MCKSLIFLDENNFESSSNMLEIINRIYGINKCKTYALSFCKDIFIKQGYFDYHIRIKDYAIGKYNIKAISQCMADLQKIYDFDCIVFPANTIGKMAAPSLAMRLDIGLVAEVTDIKKKDGMLEMIRPAFDGKLYARIVNCCLKPIMMTAAANAFKLKKSTYKNTEEILHIPKTLPKETVRIVRIEKKSQTNDICKSEILVSGGGGIGKNFKKLNLLARELDGMVASSRKNVDLGIAPRQIQVGQSGKIVSPKLYLALGIYGSLQHMAGLKNVENLIAVNTNPNAPICSAADIVVRGDAADFIEKLVEKIQAEKRNLDILGHANT